MSDPVKPSDIAIHIKELLKIFPRIAVAKDDGSYCALDEQAVIRYVSERIGPNAFNLQFEDNTFHVQVNQLVKE